MVAELEVSLRGEAEQLLFSAGGDYESALARLDSLGERLTSVRVDFRELTLHAHVEG